MLLLSVEHERHRSCILKFGPTNLTLDHERIILKCTCWAGDAGCCRRRRRGRWLKSMLRSSGLDRTGRISRRIVHVIGFVQEEWISGRSRGCVCRRVAHGFLDATNAAFLNASLIAVVANRAYPRGFIFECES